MWFTYPEDMEDNMIPVGDQATGIPFEVHRAGFGVGGLGGKMVTPVRTYTSDSTPLGFQEETDRTLDRGEERDNLSDLSGSEEEDFGRVPHDLG